MQLIELGIPMVIALNMMDEVRSNGGTIKIKAMERGSSPHAGSTR